MEFIDLKAQQDRIRDLITERIVKVLNHRQFINGPEVEEFERAMGKYVVEQSIIIWPLMIVGWLL